jgi:hypothetical protein
MLCCRICTGERFLKFSEDCVVRVIGLQAGWSEKASNSLIFEFSGQFTAAITSLAGACIAADEYHNDLRAASSSKAAGSRHGNEDLKSKLVAGRFSIKRRRSTARFA